MKLETNNEAGDDNHIDAEEDDSSASGLANAVGKW
jgi:hypothetical protein